MEVLLVFCVAGAELLVLVSAQPVIGIIGAAFQDAHVMASANFSITAVSTPILTAAESLGSTPGARSILLATIGPAIFSCVLQGR